MATALAGLSDVSRRVIRLQQARTPAKNLRRLQTESRGYPLGTGDFAVQGNAPLGDRIAHLKRYVKPIEPRLEEGGDTHFDKRISPVAPGQRGSWNTNVPRKFQKRISPVDRPKMKRKDWTIRKHGMSSH